MPTNSTYWPAEWTDYVNRTGKRPSTQDPDSRAIYNGVVNGASRGLPGYREFWEAHKRPTRDWRTEWDEFVSRTGRRPSQRDPESVMIYQGMQNGVRRGVPGYYDFWHAHLLKPQAE